MYCLKPQTRRPQAKWSILIDDLSKSAEDLAFFKESVVLKLAKEEKLAASVTAAPGSD